MIEEEGVLDALDRTCCAACSVALGIPRARRGLAHPRAARNCPDCAGREPALG